MVILSCPVNKNKNFNLRKKSLVYYWKGGFVDVSGLKTQLSVINWTFFPRIQILIFLRETTQNDHTILLYKFETEQIFFGCVGSCGYAPASVKFGSSLEKVRQNSDSRLSWIRTRKKCDKMNNEDKFSSEGYGLSSRKVRYIYL